MSVSDLFGPSGRNDSSPPGVQYVTIDPVTRIEGHLRIELRVEQGIVRDTWSVGTAFRGIEPILVGRDPRDAWAFVQRICGVCTTVHALASVRAVEQAFGIEVPDNARILRNLIEAAQFVHDHVIHFYHLHGLDWVDVVSALSADPQATSLLAKRTSDWANSSPEYFDGIRAVLRTYVESGQLGLFANGYWGHPAYRLPPEANLLVVSHYLEALDWQREFVKVHAILGGKNPHLQSYLVGGMATPISDNGISSTKIEKLRTLVALGLDFVTKVYIPDLLLVGSYYPDWATLGAGPGNYLAFGDLPRGSSGNAHDLLFPDGVILGTDGSGAPGCVDLSLIREYISRSWYAYTDQSDGAKHPSEGETIPQYTGPQPPYDRMDLEGKYSWVKAPRYRDAPMEVGPLARLLVAYNSGDVRTRAVTNAVLDKANLTTKALSSTLGRMIARAIETQIAAESMTLWLDQLETNLANGDVAIHNGKYWDPSSWPRDAEGWGTTEAPRGACGHWVRICDGKISRYQIVVPSTWNGSPRDANGIRGPWEHALLGLPVADPDRPLEVLRTLHSFDPCMACAVHVLGARKSSLTLPPSMVGRVLHRG